jgi:multicomponent Na+:H+ antiporter subunit E
LIRLLILSVLLAAAWLLLSGHFEPLLLGLGALSVAGVVACVSRLGTSDAEGLPLRLLPGLARYAPWLAWQIIVSSVDVAKRIVQPHLPIDPAVIRVPADQQSAPGRVTYANSITLTPGTISLDVAEAEIEVHALTSDAASELAGGEMGRRVRAMERR